MDIRGGETDRIDGAGSISEGRGIELFDPPDSAAFQADLNTMGMGRGFCQDSPDNSFREFSRALILFADDENPPANFDIVPIGGSHECSISVSIFKGVRLCSAIPPCLFTSRIPRKISL